jgi:Putative sugar-binding domain
MLTNPTAGTVHGVRMGQGGACVCRGPWIPLAVGVAGGPEKVAGIVGAARAGLLKALVTDEDTANGCLEISDVA